MSGIEHIMYPRPLALIALLVVALARAGDRVDHAGRVLVDRESIIVGKCVDED